MADSNVKREPSTTKKVLKFLFLPGFSRNIEQMSFFKPVAMRLIATVFEQAGLLRRDHPAIYYGIEGVEKTTFHGIMHEAYRNLKITGGNFYQWGIFSSVILMIASLIISLSVVALKISSMMISVTNAQLFDHPTGQGTGLDTIPSASVQAGPFNMYLYDPESAHSDWGILIIDKMFREGIAGTGGALQNAFGSLMEIYNSAVLAIAGIMLFWLIVSLVIDTARTGTIGGGRHNIVWAPIRIIFALGLLVPLGSTGFSAGQHMVLKLAEWGSNLGTNGWYQYVKSASSANMITGTEVEEFASIIDGLNRVWICSVTHNIAVTQAGGDSNSIISLKNIKGSEVKNPSLGTYTRVFSFKSNRGDNCGTITFPGPIKAINQTTVVSGAAYSESATAYSSSGTTAIDANLDATVSSGENETGNPLDTSTGDIDSILNESGSIAGSTMSTSGSPGVMDDYDPVPITVTSSYQANSTKTELSDKLYDYLNAVRAAFLNPIVGDINAINFDNGWLMQETRAFGCSISSLAVGADPLKNSGMCGSWSPGQFDEIALLKATPSAKGYMEMLKKYGQEIKDNLESANKTFKEYIENTELVQGAMHDGWPSMGWWYYDLYKLNYVVMGSGKIPVTISAGAGGSGKTGKKISEAFGYYGKWWAKVGENIPMASASPYGYTTEGGAVKLKISKGGYGVSAVSLFSEFVSEPVLKVFQSISDSIEGAEKDAGGEKAAKEKPFKYAMDVSKSLIANSSLKNTVPDLAAQLGNSLIGRMIAPAGGIARDVAKAVRGPEYPLTKLIKAGDAMLKGGEAILHQQSKIYALGALASLAGFGTTEAIADIISAVANGPIGNAAKATATAVIAASVVPLYYVPMMPFIKVAFAVMTWMMSVFQAVIMVPFAALSHISTADGNLMVGKQPWIVWLNLLFRPLLTVIGFVGSILVLNTFFLYWSAGFSMASSHTTLVAANTSKGIGAILQAGSYCAMYCAGIYTAANASFGLMDSLPAALFTYMGGGQDVQPVQENLSGAVSQVGGGVSGVLGSGYFSKLGSPVKGIAQDIEAFKGNKGEATSLSTHRGTRAPNGTPTGD